MPVNELAEVVENKIHWNVGRKDRRCQCGRLLRTVKWTKNKEDVTCNECVNPAATVEEATVPDSNFYPVTGTP